MSIVTYVTEWMNKQTKPNQTKQLTAVMQKGSVPLEVL